MPGLREQGRGQRALGRGVEQDDLPGVEGEADPLADRGALAGRRVRTRSRPASVSTVTTCRAPIYSTPNTSPRTPPSSARRTCSGRTPRTSPAGRGLACSVGHGDRLAAQATPRRRARRAAQGRKFIGRAADELRPRTCCAGGGRSRAACPPAGPAFVHHRDLVGHRHGLDLVVGDVDRGGADAGRAGRAAPRTSARGRRRPACPAARPSGRPWAGGRWRGPAPRAGGRRRRGRRPAGPADGRCAGASPSPRPAADLGARHALGSAAESRCSGARSYAGRARTAGTRRRCRAREARRKVTSSPSRRISPEVGSSSPAIMRSVVVLPQPEGPEQHEEAAVLDGQRAVLAPRRSRRRPCAGC